MQKKVETFSFGGLGDFLIALADLIYRDSLSQFTQLQNYYFIHYAKKRRYDKQIISLINLLGQGEFREAPKQQNYERTIIDEKIHQGCIRNQDFYYLKNRLNRNLDLRLPFSLVSSNISHGNYFVVNTVAGPNRRFVCERVINTLLEAYPNSNAILVGQGDGVDIKKDRVFDYQNVFEDLTDVFELIENAIFTVGPDGIIPYYSALRGFPTIINYHKDVTKNNYSSTTWDNVLKLTIGEKLVNLKETDLNNLKELVKYI